MTVMTVHAVTERPGVHSHARRPTELVRAQQTHSYLLHASATTSPIARAHFLEHVVLVNLSVADSLAFRYVGRGIPSQDLVQVARLGLVKAVHGFDPDAGFDFLSYAVPTITGELKRHFRRSLCDRDRLVLRLRFVDELTQGEIGGIIGVTQMQVSRILSRILCLARDELAGEAMTKSRHETTQTAAQTAAELVGRRDDEHPDPVRDHRGAPTWRLAPRAAVSSLCGRPAGRGRRSRADERRRPPGRDRSDRRAGQAMEDLQFLLGEGPCLEASRGRRPVLQPDLGRSASSRWPEYGPAVLEAGVAAIFAFPLQVGAIRLGILDLYRETPGSLDSEQLADALAYADAAVVILLHLQDQMTPGQGLHPQLGDPLHRAEVHQATGVVAVQAALGLTDALLLLRAHAYAADRPILQIAREVLAGTLRLPLKERDHE